MARRLTIALLMVTACSGATPAPSSRARTTRTVTSKELSADDVRRVVVARSDSLRQCYQREAQQSRNLAGVVTATWLVEPAGNVTKATISDSTLHNPTVEGCVLREVKGLRFPLGASVSTIVWPFRFGVALDLDAGT